MHFKNIKAKVVLIASVMLLSGFVVLFNGSNQPMYDQNTMESAVVIQNSNIGQYADGSNSQGGVYDPFNQELYITNSCSNNVTVVNAFLNHSVANIAVGSDPYGISYVPYDHNIYVNNHKSNNISVISSVTNTVVSSIKLPGSPQFSVYDPLTQELYVSGSEYNQGVIWEINVTDNNTFYTPSLPFESCPYGMAFDPYNGYVYVADYTQNDVYALSPSGAIVAYIPVGEQPYGVAFDTSNKMLYVSDYDFNGLISGCPQEYNVSIINTVNNTFVKNVAPGTSPEGVTYDPVNGYIYVANYLSGNISVISPATESIIQSLPAMIGNQKGPSAIVYDPVLQQVISVNDVSGKDSTLNYNSVGGIANKYMDSTATKSIAYDPENHLLYAGNSTSINVYSLNGSLIKSIPTSAAILSIIYANNTVFAAVNSNTAQITIINTDTNSVTKTVNLTYSSPDGLAYDSRNNTLFIAFPYNNDVGVMDLSNHSIVKNLEVGICPGALTYSNVTNQVYVAQHDENIHIINASNYVNIFPYSVPGSYPSEVIYDPNTNFIYIANSGNNSMFIINESNGNFNSSLSTPFYKVPLGSPQQSIALNPSNGLIYIMQSGTDNVTVFNPILNKTVGSINSPYLSNSGLMTYIPGDQILLDPNSNNYLEEISPAPTFNVTIGVKTLIPAGNTWNLQIQPSMDSAFAQVYSSSQSSTHGVFLTLPNGTYDLNISTSYSKVPSIHGDFVVNGTEISLNYYNVNFTESGLPSGTIWYLNLSNGQTYKTTSNTISFQEHNGNYPYTVSTSNKIYHAPASSFTVNGAAVSEPVTFSLYTYSVTFTESGLPSGTTWSVTLNGTTESSTTDTITFSVPNGTYSYSIGSVSGYTASNLNGSVTVNGNNIPISITFSSTSPLAKQPSSGISRIELYGIIGAVVAIAAIGSAIALVRKRK